jgi:biopolymer transport protein ExbD
VKIELPARPRRRIVSLVPMVDVVMNLLFFFMLATTYAELKPVALSLAGPIGVSPGIAAVPHLRVAADSLQLDGTTLDWKRVLARLKAQHDPRVIVEPAPGLPVQPLLTALDKLREAGIAASLGRATP